jgi:hypothetical protein
MHSVSIVCLGARDHLKIQKNGHFPQGGKWQRDVSRAKSG